MIIDWKALGNALKNIRKQKGIKREEMAAQLNISISSLYRIEAGQPPSAENLIKAAYFLGIDLNDLIEFSTKESLTKRRISNEVKKDLDNKIPIFSSLYTKDIIQYIELPYNLNYSFGIKIADNSMVPKFKKEDIALVKEKSIEEIKNGDIVVSVFKKNTLIRKFYKFDEGFLLMPINEAHLPTFISPKNFSDHEFFGIVVGKIGMI